MRAYIDSIKAVSFLAHGFIQGLRTELSSVFTPDESVFTPDYEHLAEIYKISDDELKSMSMEEIIIDRITKLTVDY